MAAEMESIAVDLPCVGCGYNLRMQPVSGVCTECAHPVVTSLHQTILRWGSQRLGKIARGMRIQAITIIIIPLILLAGVFLEWLLYKLAMAPSNEIIGIATYGAMGLAATVHVLAAWMVLAAPRQESSTISRWLCRIFAFSIPLVLFIPPCVILLQRIFVFFTEYWLLALPCLTAGWGIFAERGAACWVEFHRRGGLINRAGLGKWSMWSFALAATLLTMLLGTLAVIAIFEDRLHLGWNIDPRLNLILIPGFLAAVGLGGISLVLIVIVLFRAANRAAELATLALAAEQAGFTAPPPPAPNAPSSP
jgi:hypothetical protein